MNRVVFSKLLCVAGMVDADEFATDKTSAEGDNFTGTQE